MSTLKKDKATARSKIGPDGLRVESSLMVIGFLVMEIIIGYEWFISGYTKVARGDFARGLAEELAEKTAGAYGWYASILNSFVIPNGTAFGYMIEIGEILIGLIFIAGPLLWLFAWGRVSNRVRWAIFALTALAAIGGIFMAINFHLANGYIHPWLVPQDSFEEGVDFDSLLAVLNLVIAAVNVGLLGALRLRTDNKIAAMSQVRPSLSS